MVSCNKKTIYFSCRDIIYHFYKFYIQPRLRSKIINIGYFFRSCTLECMKNLTRFAKLFSSPITKLTEMITAFQSEFPQKSIKWLKSCTFTCFDNQSKIFPYLTRDAKTKSGNVSQWFGWTLISMRKWLSFRNCLLTITTLSFKLIGRGLSLHILRRENIKMPYNHTHLQITWNFQLLFNYIVHIFKRISLFLLPLCIWSYVKYWVNGLNSI